ncbi:MAG: flagellar hook capping protein [Rhodothermaceae bacterium]|nr:flagellar hook capping protein [Rhodothermaceae bacterium]
MDPLSPVDSGQQLAGFTSASEASLSRDDFLQLLVTQLGNQDPLNPMDGQEFAAQLAQFSSLEQLININESMIQSGEINGLLAQSVNSGVAADLIGKKIEAEGDEFQYGGEDTTSLRFELFTAASDVQVEIYNPAGQLIRTESLSNLDSGQHTFEWDGKSGEGEQQLNGQYSFKVTATDPEGATVNSRTFISGTVDRVTYNQNGIFLWIGDTAINMGNVSSVIGDQSAD